MTDNKQNPPDKKEDPAVNLIRSRIDALYGDEPSVNDEIKTVEEAVTGLSKHQKFMKKLNDSGKSMAEIQTEWHKYYLGLSNEEKHEVWQEFYVSNQKPKEPSKKTPEKISTPDKNNIESQTQKKAHVYHDPKVKSKSKRSTLADAKQKIKRSVANNSKTKLSAASHFKSLLFGLSLGGFVFIVLLFSFFNERFITPFITPSKTVSSTPIIIDPNSTTAGPENLVIIPKINVEVPVVYNTASIQEKDIQNGLENGVVHYITTPNPGEQGNSVVVGHSSNNILNKGKYKFAFVLLNKLEIGDTFSMTKNSKRYVYRVYKKEIVKPTDTSVLGNTDKSSTVTLITCDPPGTSINRLIIVGEQISPDPITNVASTAKPDGAQPSIVPGNSPTLWSRLTGWLFS